MQGACSVSERTSGHFERRRFQHFGSKSSGRKNNEPEILREDDDFAVFTVDGGNGFFEEPQFEDGGDAKERQNRFLNRRIHGQGTPNHPAANLMGGTGKI